MVKWGVIAVLVACLASVLTGCGDEVVPAPAAGSRQSDSAWDQAGIAYALPTELDEPSFWLGFRGHQVEVRSELDDQGYRITRQLGTTSTNSAGVFLLGPIDGKHELWLLTKDDDWSRVADDVDGLPVADPTSPWLFWMTSDHEITAYDTDAHKTVATQPVPLGSTGFLWFSNGDTAYYTAKTGTMQWTVGEEPTSQPITRPGDYVDTARDGFLGLMNEEGGYRVMSGETKIFELGRVHNGWGRISPDAKWITFDDRDDFAVLTLPEMKPVELPLPKDWFVASVEWTPDSRLVVSGANDEASDPGVRSFVCQPASATCEEYPKRALPYSMTNSARGQFILAEPRNFDESM